MRRLIFINNQDFIFVIFTQHYKKIININDKFNKLKLIIPHSFFSQFEFIISEAVILDFSSTFSIESSRDFTSGGIF